MTVVGIGDIIILHHLDGTKEKVRLGNELSRGGSGVVYILESDERRVVKIYLTPEEAQNSEAKISAMLANAPKLPEINVGSDTIAQLAWPIASAYAENGRFVGFAMRTIDMEHTAELEYVLYPKAAEKYGLRNDLGVSVSLAANICSIVNGIHECGHAIVDLKPLNLKYYIDELLVVALDCDGFYINLPGQKSDAPDVTPDYLAPEFQKDCKVTVPEYQDRFALAVILFKLFNFDIHPYVSIPKKGRRVPSELNEKIRLQLYPYGLTPHASVEPHSASIHETFPKEIRELFDRAFGLDHKQRPSAIEWWHAIRPYAMRKEGKLVRCDVDSAHFRFVDMPCGACMRKEILESASGINCSPHSSSKPLSPSQITNQTQHHPAQLVHLGSSFHQHQSQMHSNAPTIPPSAQPQSQPQSQSPSQKDMWVGLVTLVFLCAIVFFVWHMYLHPWINNKITEWFGPGKTAVATTINPIPGNMRTYLGMLLANDPANQGAAVVYVDPQGPADRAGIQPEDIIQKVAGQSISNAADLHHLIIGGDNYQLSILRNFSTPVSVTFHPPLMGKNQFENKEKALNKTLLEITKTARENIVPADMGIQLVRQAGCEECHAYDHKLKGPSFLDISRHYNAVHEALPWLMLKIRRGGSGVWGDTVMPPTPTVVSRSEVSKISRFILQLKHPPSAENMTSSEFGSVGN